MKGPLLVLVFLVLAIFSSSIVLEDLSFWRIFRDLGEEECSDQIRDRREVGTIDAGWRTRNGESSESRRV